VYTAEALHKRSDFNMASVFIVNIFFFRKNSCIFFGCILNGHKHFKTFQVIIPEKKIRENHVFFDRVKEVSPVSRWARVNEGAWERGSVNV